VIKFGPGISNAYMQWAPSENMRLDFGYFPYKYNAAAKNMGEYLFRTEAYPTIIYTGGWGWLNDAQYRTLGAKLTWETGSFKQDIGFFGEYFNAPIYDISPAYVATFKASGFTVGGAASLHRFINPSPKTRKLLTRSYQYYENFFLPEVQSKTKYRVTLDGYGGSASSVDVKYAPGSQPSVAAAQAAVWAVDSALLQAAYSYTSASQIPVLRDSAKSSTTEGRAAKYQTMLKEDINSLAGAEQNDTSFYYGNANNAGKQPAAVAFDNAAVKLLAFFELDFNAMLGLDGARLGAFNLYGEVAQLGLKNHPIFYTNSAQRRPIMLGASVPTFGLLSNLSFEIEYLKNPNIESIASTYDKLDLPPDPDFRYKVYDQDDTKWSVHASRGLNKFLTLYLQVANDHMRLKDNFARPEYIPITNEPSHWYWLTRIQWMI
jgi:hypothetical protein